MKMPREAMLNSSVNMMSIDPLCSSRIDEKRNSAGPLLAFVMY
jgi:hypothetical protein